ncbi:MAG: barstar family protein [Oligoflexia bacterium]|nr:barstar family protein [Oligoflexia bacterium]
MKEIILDGDKIDSMEDFHDQISILLKFPEFYGRNLDALWDCLTGFIDTNFKLIWKNHAKSKVVLGDRFEKIIILLDDLKKCEKNFSYELV